MSYPNPPPMYGVLHPPYYAPSPIGMVGVGMMGIVHPPPPPTQVISTSVSAPPVMARHVTITTSPVISRPIPARELCVDKPPNTTVFVGNISEKAPDIMIKELLGACGTVVNWKRVQGASGKLQAFGFCEFEDPEATLRCIRLLNDMKVTDKNLLVKVDPKTKELLSEYKRKKRKLGEAGGDSEEASKGEEEDSLDEATLNNDELARVAMLSSIEEYRPQIQALEASFPAEKMDSSSHRRKLDGPRHLTIEDMDIDGDRKDLINREIEIFRKQHKKEEEAAADRGGDDRSSSKRHHHHHHKHHRRDLQEAALLEERHSRHHNSLPVQPPVVMVTSAGSHRLSEEKGLVVSPSVVSGSHHPRHHYRSRSRSHETAGSRRSRDHHRHRHHHYDEQEEAMRKELERQMRAKEAAYQLRLQRWESRELKKGQDYERHAQKVAGKEKEMQAEAVRLREFFEDYDDEVEDAKYYRGVALQQRLRERREEELADERDRLKEVEAVEETRRRIIESGDPEAELKILQLEQSMQEHLRKRLHLDFDELPIVEGAARHRRRDHGRRRKHKKRREREEGEEEEVEEEVGEIIKTPVSPPSPASGMDVPTSNGPVVRPVPLSAARTPPTFQQYHYEQQLPPAHESSKAHHHSLHHSLVSIGYDSDEEGERDQEEPEEGEAVSHQQGASEEEEEEEEEDHMVQEETRTSSSSSTTTSTSSSEDEDGGYDQGLRGAGTPPPLPSQTQAAHFPSSAINTVLFSMTSHNEPAVVRSSAAAAAFREDDAENDTPTGPTVTGSSGSVNRPSSTQRWVSGSGVGSGPGARGPQQAAPNAGAPSTGVDKKALIKQLVDSIPSERSELFVFPIDWTMVTTEFVSSRIKPWVDKKIVAYIGEDEPTLSSFICDQLVQRNRPEKIEKDIEMVLDTEAAVFVQKMWRLLIYVIEEKRRGLTT